MFASGAKAWTTAATSRASMSARSTEVVGIWLPGAHRASRLPGLMPGSRFDGGGSSPSAGILPTG
jgi:hypothetical protein